MVFCNYTTGLKFICHIYVNVSVFCNYITIFSRNPPHSSLSAHHFTTIFYLYWLLGVKLVFTSDVDRTFDHIQLHKSIFSLKKWKNIITWHALSRPSNQLLLWSLHLPKSQSGETPLQYLGQCLCPSGVFLFPGWTQNSPTATLKPGK